MKTIAAFFLLLALASCTKREKMVIIRGSLENGDGKKLLLQVYEGTHTLNADSLVLKAGGNFRFRYHTREPQFFFLLTENDEQVTLLAEPGEKIIVRGPYRGMGENYSLEGSEASMLVKELEDRLRETIHVMDSLRSAYHLLEETASNLPLKEELSARYEEAINDQRRSSIRFILGNYSSLASFIALYQETEPGELVLNHFHDLQYMKIVTDSLKKYYPRSKYVRMLETDFNNELSQMRQAQLRELVDRAPSGQPDIALPDLKGDTMVLSSLRGQYTLLGFWSTGNRKSLEENQELILFHRRYHPKGFRIYQVALDTSLAAVQRVVEYEGYPWVQVIDREAATSFNIRLFNITSLPANYLINPGGEIIEKNLFGDELRKKLSQIYD